MTQRISLASGLGSALPHKNDSPPGGTRTDKCRERTRRRGLTCLASRRSPRWRGGQERRQTDRVAGPVEECGFGCSRWAGSPTVGDTERVPTAGWWALAASRQLRWPSTDSYSPGTKMAAAAPRARNTPKGRGVLGPARPKATRARPVRVAATTARRSP